MKDGVDVVYQGVLASDGWRGQADFLMRVETPSALGAWSYEALDTKLARHAKPAYILQLCFYSEQIARIQGLEPAHIHVLLGNQTQESFTPSEFGAYYRRVRERLERVRRRPPPDDAAVPLPAVPHLRLQAALRRALGRGRPPLPRRRDQPRPDREARAAWSRHARGARRCGHATSSGPAAWRRRPSSGSTTRPRCSSRRGSATRTAGSSSTPQPASGFALLPDPSPGDLFFDFEGNPFWDTEGSLEYLWGFSDRDDAFEALWATSRDEEQAGLRDVHRPRPRAARGAPGHARLPLRAVRDHGAAADDGPLRHARGRARRPPAARGVRRPLPRRPGRSHDLAAGVRAEGDRAPARLRAHRADQGRRHLDRRVRALDDRARRRDPRRDRGVQPRGLHRHAGARRLAARAAWGGAREVRAVPAAGAGQESKPVKPEKAERAALREAAARDGRPGRRARGRAPRLPRPRAQARLVGDVRQGGHDARGAARGQGGDRRARVHRRLAAGEEVDRVHVHLSGAGAEARQEPDRPGDAARRRRACSATTPTRASSSSSAAQARTRCRCRRRFCRAARTARRRRRQRSSGSGARCSRATAAIRRSSRCSAASRSTATCRRTSSRS